MPSDVVSKRTLLILIAVSLLIRILFVIFGADVVWEDIHNHPDSPSFIDTAYNLKNHGIYSNDLSFRDGLFTRVPGYALLIFVLTFLPGSVYLWLTATQIILDCLTNLLLALLGYSLLGQRGFWGVGLLYAFYPFTLFWVSVAVPDTLTTFLAVGVVFVLSQTRPRIWLAVAHGGMVAIVTLSREYLGLLALAAGFIWIKHSPRHRDILRFGIAGVLGFMIVYSPWPLRNLINHGEVVLLRADSSGYRQYAPDLLAAIDWMSAWTPNQDVYLTALSIGTEPEFPDHVLTEVGKTTLTSLQARALECGNGIRLWGGQSEVTSPCTAELVEGFALLKRDYVQRHPIRWAFEVPLHNLYKTVFKSQLTDEPSDGRKAWIIRTLFFYRTALIVVGLLGVWRFRKTETIQLCAFSVATIYLFMAFAVRGVQMRYLLQADVILLVPAGLMLASFVSLVRPKRA